ncbi:hypothetical protein SAMN05421823_102754 [Catalinimonas alkaloidigena]|uniref:Uncharacterized protein n=1 Tax=Catalinimonas alkaloidigena TaxID=1075417 RepID=A0A1G9BZ83_9BACT|nr:hypothetical protein SAMN05421823_102754 [Catalinimonas alkaloidigena]
MEAGFTQGMRAEQPLDADHLPYDRTAYPFKVDKAARKC